MSTRNEICWRNSCFRVNPTVETGINTGIKPTAIENVENVNEAIAFVWLGGCGVCQKDIHRITRFKP